MIFNLKFSTIWIEIKHLEQTFLHDEQRINALLLRHEEQYQLLGYWQVNTNLVYELQNQLKTKLTVVKYVALDSYNMGQISTKRQLKHVERILESLGTPVPY